MGIALELNDLFGCIILANVYKRTTPKYFLATRLVFCFCCQCRLRKIIFNLSTSRARSIGIFIHIFTHKKRRCRWHSDMVFCGGQLWRPHRTLSDNSGHWLVNYCRQLVISKWVRSEGFKMARSFSAWFLKCLVGYAQGISTSQFLFLLVMYQFIGSDPSVLPSCVALWVGKNSFLLFYFLGASLRRAWLLSVLTSTVRA